MFTVKFAWYFLFVLSPVHFQTRCEMVPRVQNVKDFVTKWILVCASWLLWISLSSWTLASSREAHSSIFFQGTFIFCMTTVAYSILFHLFILMKCFYHRDLNISLKLLEATVRWRDLLQYQKTLRLLKSNLKWLTREFWKFWSSCKHLT